MSGNKLDIQISIAGQSPVSSSVTVLDGETGPKGPQGDKGVNGNTVIPANVGDVGGFVFGRLNKLQVVAAGETVTLSDDLGIVIVSYMDVSPFFYETDTITSGSYRTYGGLSGNDIEEATIWRRIA